MKVKIIDMSSIADKSLDVYCSNNATFTQIVDKKRMRYNTKNVNSTVGKIFDGILNDIISNYSQSYDRIFIVVPCFPMMRMKHASIITRFICKNSDFLGSIGVSSSQFQELFEKFISLKCKNEYVNKVHENIFILNGKNFLFNDWKNGIIDYYGSSLVDDSVLGIFQNNPNYISNMEANLEIFTTTDDEIKYKISQIMQNLT